MSTPDFRSFCLEHGVFMPDDLTPGQWRRCATVDHPQKRGLSGNGTVKLSESGSMGWCRNFATMDSPATWKSSGHTQDSPVQKAVSAERMREKIRLESDAIAEARKYFSSCKPLKGSTPYLESKELGVEGCSQLRRNVDGFLVVPMMNGHLLISTQTIDHEGGKKFFRGAPSKGTSFTIFRNGSTVTLLCEGLATGLTLFTACPDASVIVCFSASNMVYVAGRLNLRGLVCVCADDDWETAEKTGKNPGLESATEAAKLLGCGIAKPDCTGSDFNDMFRSILRKMREDDSLSKFKKQHSTIRQSALAKIRSIVMKQVAYKAPRM